MEKRLTRMFYESGQLREYIKNSFLFYEGDAPNNVYLIEKGVAKVFQSTMQGQNVTFFLRKTGDIFGFAEVILEQNRARSAQCLDHCRIWALPGNVFYDQINQDAGMNREVLRIVSHRLLQQQRTVEMLISQPTSYRLAWLLEQLSVPLADGSWMIENPLTHVELSGVIGCNRQTVSEILSRWKSVGHIHYDRTRMIIKSFDEIF